eukprot:scaffold97333_cov96-Phaeocystis_antarctica.AAC.2
MDAAEVGPRRSSSGVAVAGSVLAGLRERSPSGSHGATKREQIEVSAPEAMRRVVSLLRLAKGAGGGDIPGARLDELSWCALPTVEPDIELGLREKLHNAYSVRASHARNGHCDAITVSVGRKEHILSILEHVPKLHDEAFGRAPVTHWFQEGHGGPELIRPNHQLELRAKMANWSCPRCLLCDSVVACKLAWPLGFPVHHVVESVNAWGGNTTTIHVAVSRAANVVIFWVRRIHRQRRLGPTPGIEAATTGDARCPLPLHRPGCWRVESVRQRIGAQK